MKFNVFLIALGISGAALGIAPLPQPPQLDTRAHVLMDYESGQFLVAHRADEPAEPASLTKLMTIYIAFDQLREGRLKLTDTALISEKAWRSEGSRSFMEVGNRVSVDVLLKGIIIQSGNDASVVLAEHIAGAEDVFADLMNQYARRLGMAGSRFTNATGLPDEAMRVTARDMALLSAAIIRDFPEYYPSFAEREFRYNNIRQGNRNLLLWRDPDVDGLKTGHTQSAGYNLAASAVRDGQRLISVVLGMSGEDARARASLTLLNYGFRFYETVTAAAPGKALDTVRPWRGEADTLALGVAAPLRVAVPRGAAGQLQVATAVAGPVFAPVEAGAALGTVTASLDGEVLRSTPLVAQDAVPEGGLLRRLVDAIRMRLQGIAPP